LQWHLAHLASLNAFNYYVDMDPSLDSEGNGVFHLNKFSYLVIYVKM
jgi:hypothetical protein